MRVPRVKFTVRRMMIAVAVMALISWAARTIVSRPYPTECESYSVHFVGWSDHTTTVVPGGPRDLLLKGYRLATLVRWPDGGFSVYLHPW
jgi:hypothetical protein